MSQNLQNFAKFQKIQLDNLVDFEKCCKTHIFLQKSVPIQPKTSNILPKFCQKLATMLGGPPLPLAPTPRPLPRRLRRPLLPGPAGDRGYVTMWYKRGVFFSSSTRGCFFFRREGTYAGRYYLPRPALVMCTIKENGWQSVPLAC